jgi:prevent-host-death family protein
MTSAPMYHKCYNKAMAAEEQENRVTSRDLRNRTADVIGRVERGESLVVTVDRRPVARLEPLPARTVWVPRQRMIDDFAQTDREFLDQLKEIRAEGADGEQQKREDLWDRT